MRYPYFICDVFTTTRFGGNPLAVLPRAEGLSTEQMQKIAREFNFSESTFVLPAKSGHTRRVRIFTPTREIPFAGHPNVGTAFVLAAAGELGNLDAVSTVTFEELAGIVPVAIERRSDGAIWCELVAPERLSLGKILATEKVAAAISLPPEEVLTRTHPPRVASVGLPFVFVEVATRAALVRARVNAAALDMLAAEGIMPDVFVYTRSGDEFDVRARMFAPLDGVPEDPATGSANGALAGLLAAADERANGTFRWRVAQGVEMGRPSVLELTAEKRDGTVEATRVAGASVLVSKGWIEAD